MGKVIGLTKAVIAERKKVEAEKAKDEIKVTEKGEKAGVKKKAKEVQAPAGDGTTESK